LRGTDREFRASIFPHGSASIWVIWGYTITPRGFCRLGLWWHLVQQPAPVCSLLPVGCCALPGQEDRCHQSVDPPRCAPAAPARGVGPQPLRRLAGLLADHLDYQTVLLQRAFSSLVLNGRVEPRRGRWGSRSDAATGRGASYAVPRQEAAIACANVGLCRVLHFRRIACGRARITGEMENPTRPYTSPGGKQSQARLIYLRRIARMQSEGRPWTMVWTPPDGIYLPRCGC